MFASPSPTQTKASRAFTALGAYYTDGHNLFQVQGLAESPELVVVEDCLTLELTIVAAAALEGLRRVTPAAG